MAECGSVNNPVEESIFFGFTTETHAWLRRETAWNKELLGNKISASENVECEKSEIWFDEQKIGYASIFKIRLVKAPCT